MTISKLPGILSKDCVAVLWLIKIVSLPWYGNGIFIAYITGSIWKTGALKDQILIKNFLGSHLNLFKGKNIDSLISYLKK